MASGVTKLAADFDLASLYPRGWESGSFRNDEGRSIYYAKAAPLGPKAGTVVFTSGYGDSINFHYDAIHNWQRRGYEVYAMDWINQGLSDREHPDVTDSNDRLLARHMRDLKTFVTNVVHRDPGMPLILSSHSMGGHIGMMFLKHYPGIFDGAVLAAPMLDVNTGYLPRPAAKIIAQAVTALGLGDFPIPDLRNLLTRIDNVSQNIRNLKSEPEDLSLSQIAQNRIRDLFNPVNIDGPNWKFLKRAYPSLDKMRHEDYFSGIKTPVLLVLGGRDKLISNDAIRFAAEELPRGYLLELPDAGHGIWNDSDKNHAALWRRIDWFVKSDIHSPTVHKPVPMPLPVPQEVFRPSPLAVPSSLGMG
jgi:lysophospholipase